MPKSAKSNRGAVIPARRPKRAIPVIMREAPKGYKWGWYCREDQRMHLQSLGESLSSKVWLEEQGKRVFLPAGKIPGKIIKSLAAKVAEQRTPIEDMWVRFMLDNGWLVLYIALPKLTLVAYPNTPNKFSRVIDLTTWLDPQQLASLTPEIIELNREMAALRLWTNRPEEKAYDVRLSRLLWTD